MSQKSSVIQSPTPGAVAGFCWLAPLWLRLPPWVVGVDAFPPPPSADLGCPAPALRAVASLVGVREVDAAREEDGLLAEDRRCVALLP